MMTLNNYLATVSIIPIRRRWVYLIGSVYCLLFMWIIKWQGVICALVVVFRHIIIIVALIYHLMI